ncbi:chitinase 1-like [Miscanthus floridulus]|uniref:chitinase 1-like n=1 Tax=Miscanthus floridulus TaxID=154761 RepID=UPI00345B422C
MGGLAVVAMVATALAVSVRAEQCGSQAGGALCPNCLCCSKWGWCGSTSDHCSSGCQSQCSGSSGGSTPPPPPPAPATPSPPSTSGGGSGSVASIISESLFNQMLLHRNDAACPAGGFYTYSAFIAAANVFSGFGTTGSADTRKRELAAFLAQTSHETTGGWATAPDGPYAWGYCFKEEQGASSGPDYCQPSTQWPCAAGKKYYGRGPIQISYNYNYGPAGQAIGAGILANPDLVASNPTVSFETAVWFWMTPQSPKPSCHAVMTGQWRPSGADTAAARLPGYGVVTNIINGGLECGQGADSRAADRIGFYKRYCDLLGVSYGDNLDCANQRPFNS